MWKATEVVKRAWDGFRHYYLQAVICMIIVALLGVLSVIPYGLGLFFFAVCPCLSIIAPFLSQIVDGIYGDILSIGYINFYLHSIREENPAPVSKVFSGFNSGYYKNSAKISIFRNIFQFLWTLLFIIPGIVKGYEYRMIPYLIADYPEKGQDEIFGMSKQMMTGNKFKVFLFDLAIFIVTAVAGGIIPGIFVALGILFEAASLVMWILAAVTAVALAIGIAAYCSAIGAELYLTLKEVCLGIPRTSGSPNSGMGGSHVVYQPENQQMLLSGNYMNDDDDAPTVDVSYPYEQPVPNQSYGRPVLVGVQGEYAGATIPIEPGQKLVVGRDASRCNVILTSPQVSRLHMTMEYVGNKFIVVDYSTYGTFDSERGQLPKETSVALMQGSTLRLGNGNDTFRLELG